MQILLIYLPSRKTLCGLFHKMCYLFFDLELLSLHGKGKTLMYQSNRSLNIPPGIPRAFDVFSYPGGREFDALSLPGDGHLITTHWGWGI